MRVEADEYAGSIGRGGLELGTRVELTENHATFERLGFARAGTLESSGLRQTDKHHLSPGLRYFAGTSLWRPNYP